MKKDTPEPQTLFFETTAEWETWLANHYDLQEGVFLKFAKKDSGIPSLTYLPAVEVALCFGWIDGQARRLDDHFYLQKFTPRRPKSIWSQINVGKVEALTAAGRMQPSGLAAVEAAKADGRWQAAYASPTTIVVPADFAAALTKNPAAKEFFDSLNKTDRYAVLWRIETAPKPDTRARRIQKLIAMLSESKKFH